MFGAKPKTIRLKIRTTNNKKLVLNRPYVTLSSPHEINALKSGDACSFGKTNEVPLTLKNKMTVKLHALY